MASRLRICRGYVAVIFALVSATAHAYNYHLDRDINNLVSEGSRLTHKYQLAKQNQRALIQEKQALDQESRTLDTERASYNKSAAIHDQQAAAQGKAINDTKADCNNNDISNNSSGHVNSCDNRIKKLHTQSQAINAAADKLEAQHRSLDAETEAFNKKALEWDRNQMVTVSTFNDSSSRLNDWLDRAYTFMNTTDFQGNIAWAHAGKLCADYKSGNEATPEQTLLDEARHALGCLSHVENARKKYYKKTP